MYNRVRINAIGTSKKMAEAICEQIAVLKEKYANVKKSKETPTAKRPSGKENTLCQQIVRNI